MTVGRASGRLWNFVNLHITRLPKLWVNMSRGSVSTDIVASERRPARGKIINDYQDINVLAFNIVSFYQFYIPYSMVLGIF